MGYKQIISYFFPYERPIAIFPRKMALYKFNEATKEQLALIEAGLARTPQEADKLLADSEYEHVLDLIEALTKKQYSVFWRQLRSLLMRIEGATDKNPLVKNKSSQFYQVKYKKNDK